MKKRRADSQSPIQNSTRSLFQATARAVAFAGVLGFPVAAVAGPEMSYGLAVDGDLWGNSFSSHVDFDDDWNLSGMNMNLSGPSIRAQAGDVSANWDQLSLAGRSFQGLSAGFAVGKADLSLLGGTVVLQPDYIERQLGDLLEKLQRPRVSPIYGARISVPLGDKFDLSASQLMTPGASQSQGKGITSLGLNYQISLRNRLALEIGHSSGGNGWQLSGASEGRKLKLQASYRQADLGFSSAGNPILLRRRNGGFVSGSFRLSNPLSLNANVQRYNDGLGGFTNLNFVSLRYAQKKRPAASVFWRSAQTQRSALSSASSVNSSSRSTQSSSVGVRLSHRLGVNRVSAQVEKLQFESNAPFALNGASTRFSLGVTRPLGRQARLSAYQILEVGSAGRTSYSSVNLSRRLGRSGVTVDLGLQYINRSVATHSGANISGQATAVRAGLAYQLRSGSTLSLQYQGNIAGSGSLSSRGAGQMYVGYSHSFSSGGPRRANLSVSERRQLGKVAVRVFEDTNNNNRWDSGEEGVPDVVVNSIGGVAQKTNAEGRFDMQDVRPGSYQFELETKTLPIEFTTLSPGEMTLQVSAGKTAELEIPVVRTGKIQGLVFRDANRNSLREPEEPGVANAIVKVAGSDIISFTDSSGQWTLHDLAPQKWRVFVETSLMGEDIENTGSGFSEVVVTPNGIAQNVLLGVAEKERPIINSFEAEN